VLIPDQMHIRVPKPYHVEVRGGYTTAGLNTLLSISTYLKQALVATVILYGSLLLEKKH